MDSVVIVVLLIGFCMFLWGFIWVSGLVVIPWVRCMFFVVKTAILIVLLIIFFRPFTSHAAPVGYSQYGDLAEEQYQDDLGLLACVVWAEAGNQDLYGKELVVDVILNRMDNPNYPNTIREVIFDDYQFSTVKDGGLDKAYYNVTQDCYTAVSNELSGRNDSEALFFCAGGYGCGTPMYKYGDHYFSK